MAACGPPPPSSAGVTLAILNAFARLDIAAEELETVEGAVEAYHAFIEIMKFAYAQRSHLGDSSFGEGNVTLAEELNSPAWAEEIRSLITAKAQEALSFYDPDADLSSQPPDHGTSPVNVVDAEGNAMSTTTTINFHFGSKRLSEATGIIWNDEMDDFSTPGAPNGFGYAPSASNFIVPGKRPMSSMSPVVVYNPTSGQVELVLGGAGGSRIISTVSYVAVRALLLGESVKAALDAPRPHNQFLPRETTYAHGFPQKVVAGLKARGHNMLAERKRCNELPQSLKHTILSSGREGVLRGNGYPTNQ